MKAAVKSIRNELEKYIIENNIQSLIMGISGGIDSALCAALAKPVCDKLQIPFYGRSLTISTNKLDEINRADLVGGAFCQNYDESLALESVFEDTWQAVKLEGWGTKESFRKGNIKARLRMIYLYDLAQAHDGMVLSTDNYTEFLLGFWTLHGDVGDFGMIQELWKTEVYDMAEWLVNNELNEEEAAAMTKCIECQATDGLGISHTDLDQILPDWKGTSREGYAKVDKLLSVHYKMLATSKEGKEKYIEKNKDCPVLQRYLKTEFKRNNPFNIDRRNIEI